MANSKITQLPVVTNAAIGATSVFPVVDSTDVTTKQLGINQLDLRYGSLSQQSTNTTNISTLNGEVAANTSTIAANQPMTTGGDMVYGGASGAPTRLPNGTAGQLLQSNGTTLAPSYTSRPQLNEQLITTGTTWTSPSNITTNSLVEFWLVGGGGGGGGAKGTFAGACGGGYGGVAYLALTGLSPSTSYVIAIGGGGAGGTITPTNGSTGGNTTLTIGATTYTAGGGGGGFLTTSTSIGWIGGGGGGNTTNATISIGGAQGFPGIGFSSGNVLAGAGASGLFGAGGTNNGTGQNGTQATIGFGGGGGGAASGSATGFSGGAGAAGCILVKWV